MSLKYFYQLNKSEHFFLFVEAEIKYKFRNILTTAVSKTIHQPVCLPISPFLYIFTNTWFLCNFRKNYWFNVSCEIWQKIKLNLLLKCRCQRLSIFCVTFHLLIWISYVYNISLSCFLNNIVLSSISNKKIFSYYQILKV